MYRRIIFIACCLLLFLRCSLVSACHIVDERSVAFIHHSSFVCDKDEVEKVSSDVENWLQAEEQKNHMNDNYWEEWTIQSDDSPFLTKNIKDSYFGFGLWMPKELQNIQDDMDIDEWLKNHGVLFSLSFGNKHKPRLRFDYRWHDDYEADWLMQLEVPF